MSFASPLSFAENRNWIELIYEGDLMHPKTISLPEGTLFHVFVEEIAHETTIYEYPHTLVYFDGPCTVEIIRAGTKLIVRGCQSDAG